MEAVHLLLAFNLFVVIVAVDARWMREALSKRFKFMGDGRSPGTGATVYDYLEKIFQVPFWLPPMDAAGCKELIAELRPTLSSPMGGGAFPQQAAAPASGPPSHPEVSALAEPAPGSASSVQSESLEIDNLEIQYMQSLVRLFPSSPRRVKRLLNTYRLLKASSTLQDYMRFVRCERGSGPSPRTPITTIGTLGVRGQRRICDAETGQGSCQRAGPGC